MTYREKFQKLLLEISQLRKGDEAQDRWFTENQDRLDLFWRLHGILGTLDKLEEVGKEELNPTQQEEKKQQFSQEIFVAFGLICIEFKKDSFQEFFEFVHGLSGFPDFKQFEREVDAEDATKLQKIFMKISWLLLWKWIEFKQPAPESLSSF